MKKHCKRLWSYWLFSGDPRNAYQDSIWQLVPIEGPPDRTTVEDSDDTYMKLVYITTVTERDPDVGMVCSYPSYSLSEDYWEPIKKEDIPLWILSRIP